MTPEILAAVQLIRAITDIIEALDSDGVTPEQMNNLRLRMQARARRVNELWEASLRT